MKPKALLILQACALAAFLLGGLTVIATIRQNLARRETIRNKLNTLSQLAAIQQTRDRYQAAWRAFEALSNAAPVSPAGLAGAAGFQTPPEIRERESKALTAGWTRRQVEVVFNEATLTQLPDFLQAAEMQRPPWSLVECTIASSRKEDGLGRVVLVMEAIGKHGER